MDTKISQEIINQYFEGINLLSENRVAPGGFFERIIYFHSEEGFEDITNNVILLSEIGIRVGNANYYREKLFEEYEAFKLDNRSNEQQIQDLKNFISENYSPIEIKKNEYESSIEEVNGFIYSLSFLEELDDMGKELNELLYKYYNFKNEFFETIDVEESDLSKILRLRMMKNITLSNIS